MRNQVWGKLAKNFLNKEMKRCHLSDEAFCEKLQEIQTFWNAEDINKQLGRKTLSANFFLFSLSAININEISLKELKTLKN